MSKIIASVILAASGILFAGEPPPITKPISLVQIDNFSFTPQTLTIRTGTTVTWVNKDDVPHTVTSNDKKFKSRALDTDEQFSFTFLAPGTNSYFCSVHPHMTGQIIVQ